jgi:hypothetical protein
MAGMEKLPSREEIEVFVKKHKIALAIGAVILAMMAMNDGGGTQMTGGGGSDAPVYDGGGGSSAPVYDGGGGGGVDMDQWREDQRRDDIEQRDRIDSIREVERCYDPDTGRSYEVSIHVGC